MLEVLLPLIISAAVVSTRPAHRFFSTLRKSGVFCDCAARLCQDPCGIRVHAGCWRDKNVSRASFGILPRPASESFCSMLAYGTYTSLGRFAIGHGIAVLW